MPARQTIADCLNWLLACLLLLGLGACSTSRQVATPEIVEQDSALLSNTADEKVPPGLQPAYIYEIDGEPVNYLRDALHLEPGEHRIRVWPRDTTPRSQQMVPDLVRIAMEHIEVLELTLDVKPGYRCYFAARTNIYQTTSVIGADTHHFPPNKFVIPVLVKEVPPADNIEGAKGLGLMAITMALPALVAPAAF